MIAYLEGRVLSLRADSAVVVTAGVGRQVYVPPALLAQVRPGAEVAWHTVLVVREDSLTLYGFATDAEREVFEILQTISGIGPRLALAILAVLDPEELRRAVAEADVDALVRVPGVGKKSAQRMLLELGSKLGAPSGPAATGARAAAGGAQAQVTEALVGLGWTRQQAEETTAEAAAAEPGAAVGQLLKSSLRALGSR